MRCPDLRDCNTHREGIWDSNVCPVDWVVPSWIWSWHVNPQFAQQNLKMVGLLSVLIYYANVSLPCYLFAASPTASGSLEASSEPLATLTKHPRGRKRKQVSWHVNIPQSCTMECTHCFPASHYQLHLCWVLSYRRECIGFSFHLYYCLWPHDYIPNGNWIFF